MTCSVLLWLETLRICRRQNYTQYCRFHTNSYCTYHEATNSENCGVNCSLDSLGGIYKMKAGKFRGEIAKHIAKYLTVGNQSSTNIRECVYLFYLILKTATSEYIYLVLTTLKWLYNTRVSDYTSLYNTRVTLQHSGDNTTPEWLYNTRVTMQH